MEKKDILRIKAEQLLKKKGINSTLYQEDLETLVEELSIFQLELEQQNEELNQSQHQLQRAKDEFADLFNNAPIGYVILDQNMKINQVNKTILNMLGTSEDALLNKRFNTIIHSDYQDQMHFCRIKMEQLQKINCDLKLNKTDNTSFFARLIGVPEKKSNGTLHYRIAILDITAEKKLELDLKKETEIAKRNEKLKSAFLANMSHEIRTPLNGILGFSELLINEKDVPKQFRQYANIVNLSGNRLLDLINNILELSKIESGNAVINKRCFNLINLIEEVTELFKANINKKGLSLEVEMDKNDKNLLRFHSDSQKIRQILNNLINNAVKFTDEGSIKVGAKVNEKDVHFHVSDTGSGVADDVRGKVFTAYYQDSGNLQNISGGTGLGLSICKNFAEMLGGKIWLESEKDKGTVFYFTIPVEKCNC